MSTQYTFCFLVGFDRCGSSMLSRVLAQHPHVNLLFQPFNSTEVSRTQWQRWNEREEHRATEFFLKHLQEGKVDPDYIRSDWFKNYSSSQQVHRGLNLVKDTKFHFKIDWLRHVFPQASVYGIWRQPEEILHSLVRNGFHKSWYGYLTPGILKQAIEQHDILAPYLPLLTDTLEEYEIMAFGIAIRTEILLQSIRETDWLVYEEVVKRTDAILNEFLKRFNLPTFDFSDVLKQDYNVAGELAPQRGSWKDFFSPEEQQRITAIFSHLNNRVTPKSLKHG